MIRRVRSPTFNSAEQQFHIPRNHRKKLTASCGRLFCYPEYLITKNTKERRETNINGGMRFTKVAFTDR